MDRSTLARKVRAALSRPSPAVPAADMMVNGGALQMALNVLKRGTPVQQGVGVTEAMVAAYLTANDTYWRDADNPFATPRNPSMWRNGTPKEATRVSLEAALKAAAPQPQPARPEGLSSFWAKMVEFMDQAEDAGCLDGLIRLAANQPPQPAEHGDAP